VLLLFFSGQWGFLEKENIYPDANVLLKVWDKVYDAYGSCHKHFSGGEPFTYPGFFERNSLLISH